MGTNKGTNAKLAPLGSRRLKKFNLCFLIPIILKPRKVVWMHGSRDHLVPIEQGIEHIEIFEQADWEVTKLQHEKGHMVNLNQLNELKSAIQSMADS